MRLEMMQVENISEEYSLRTSIFSVDFREYFGITIHNFKPMENRNKIFLLKLREQPIDLGHFSHTKLLI